MISRPEWELCETDAKLREALGLDWVINLKENQPELLAEAQRVSAERSVERVDDHPELQLGMPRRSTGR